MRHEGIVVADERLQVKFPSIALRPKALGLFEYKCCEIVGNPHSLCPFPLESGH